LHNFACFHPFPAKMTCLRPPNLKEETENQNHVDHSQRTKNITIRGNLELNLDVFHIK